jgi:outer membrane protein assembly factor BamB
MKEIIMGLLLLITLPAFSQKNQIQVLSNEKIVGKNLIDGSDIKGIEYLFSERIHEIFLDTTTGFLTAQLRGLTKNGKWVNNNGNIVQYDIKNQKVLWSKRVAYLSSDLQQFSNTMIYTIGNKSYCLDVNTGNELWEVKSNMYFVDPINRIGVGYLFKNTTGYSNELQGIDLKNGKVLWKREINREYGWNDVFYLNYSTIIVVAAGLHAINIKTGKGWNYQTITGKKDYTGTVAANALGVAAGLLTGTFLISTGHNLVRDLVSNTLVDSTSIYFASKEQIAKINKHTGNVIWRSPLPKDLVSKSSIFMNDSVLFLINNGMALMGYRELDFGKPFFAAYDKQSGKTIFLSLLENKDGPILRYQIQNGEFFFLFKNRIAKHSMQTGNLITERYFPKEDFGELKFFVGNQVFITNQNGDLMSLQQSDSTKVFVFTSQNKTLSLNSELNNSKTIDGDDLSIYYLRTRDYKFIAKDKKTLIIDNTGQKIAEIAATSKAFAVDNTLYDTQDRSLIKIDLRKIIKNE